MSHNTILHDMISDDTIPKTAHTQTLAHIQSISNVCLISDGQHSLKLLCVQCCCGPLNPFTETVGVSGEAVSC